MKEYETLLITRATLTEKEVADLITKLTKLIKSHQGKIFFTQNWGKRRLAYLIQKEKEGIYIHFDYAAAPSVVKELEWTLKINENVFRFLTLVLNQNVDVSAREKELEELSKAEKVKATAAAAAPTETQTA